MSDTVRGELPALYAPLLPDFFDRPAIRETRATCDDCAMCDKGKSRADLDAAFFRPDMKCCTYHPTIPNYLVGAVLHDPRPELAEGARRLREKIAARVGVTPGWLAAPRKYLVLFDAGRELGFGRSEELLCPYFEKDGGRCTIWHHRESVCGTFFCKHVAGASAHSFWTALKLYLGHVEASLSRHVATRIAAEVTEPEGPRMRLTLDDLADRPPNAAAYAAYWGSWIGREEDFYVECHRRVRALSREEFDAIVHNARGLELLAAATSRYDVVTAPKLAPYLVLNHDMRVLPAEGGVVVTTYSRYDSLFLTDALYGVLKELGPGETVKDTLARLYRDRDIEMPEELLLGMQLHGVVVPPAG